MGTGVIVPQAFGKGQQGRPILKAATTPIRGAGGLVVLMRIRTLGCSVSPISEPNSDMAMAGRIGF